MVFVISEAKADYLIVQPAFEIKKNLAACRYATSRLLHSYLIHAFASQPPPVDLSI
jgi:hypothetical protein